MVACGGLDSLQTINWQKNLILIDTQTGAKQEIVPPPGVGGYILYTLTPEGRVWCLLDNRVGGDGYELLGQSAYGVKKWERIIAQVELPDNISFAGWPPDGKHLLLNSYENDQYYLWLMDRSAFEKGQMKPPYRWHGGRSPVWNSDGSRAAFIHQGGIWTAEPGQPAHLFWSAENISALLRWVDDDVVFQVENNTKVTIAKTNGKRQTVLITVTPPNSCYDLDMTKIKFN